MRFQILGPLEVVADDGPVLIRGLRRQLLVAKLLLNVGQIVPVVRLIDALWPDDPPHSAVENIRTYVYELRSQLRARGDRPRLDTYSHAYRLNAEPDELDMLRFNALTAAGEEALKRSDFSRGAALLGEALELWRDVPLSGLELNASMQGRVAMLEERRWSTLLKWIKARLALGEREDVIPTLRELVADRPLDESLWCMLATTLHSLGRTGEALEACAEARSTLVDQLGIDPGPELKRVQHAILNQEHSAAGTRLGAASPPPSLTPSEIPTAVPNFVGRASELNRLEKLIRESASHAEPRIVALHGPPGIGKTATALTAAAAALPDLPDGQLYAQLEGSTDALVAPVDALALLLGGFGIAADELPTSLEGRRSLYRSLTADCRMLVLLDDLPPGYPVAPLIPAGRSIVLITSRSWLIEIPVHARIVLGPLSRSESVQMLAWTIGADRVAKELRTAIAVAEACGHIPLALQIVGLRLASRPEHPMEFLADPLTSGNLLDELSMNGLDVRSRYESSYARLDPESRRCFRALGCLDTGKVEADRVAELLELPTCAADRLLEQLVQSGLLLAGSGSDHATTYLVPALASAYASELVASEEREVELRYAGSAR
jgi:DNA-binding SARP family transcriptional activator